MNRGGEVTNLGEKLVLAAAFGVWRATKGITSKGGLSRSRSPEDEGGRGASKGVSVEDPAPRVAVFPQQVQKGAPCSHFPVP